MQEEYVQLVVGGQMWDAWERSAVQYGAKEATRTFAFTATDDSGEGIKDQWNWFPGAEVSVQASGDLVCRGFINKMSPSFQDKAHHVEVSGRSKSQDAVDSSADHDTHEFKDKTIEDIAKALDKQNVGFKLDSGVKAEKIPIFRVNPGETVFQAIERIARKQQLLLIGQPDGSIKIAKGGNKRVHTPLIEGQNILGASADFDDTDKHSEYTVRGQRTFGTAKKPSLQIQAKAKDPSVKRKRPKIILPETDIDDKSAKKRAKHHRDRQQGESVSASVKVQGWRDDNGLLWEPNTLVYIHSPMLKLDMDLLLESVNLSQDQSGTFAQLSFVHPKALGSDASTGSKASDYWQWQAPDE